MVLFRDKCLAFFPLRFIKGRIKTASKKIIQGPPKHSCIMGKKNLGLLWLFPMFKASGGWGQITGQMCSHLELKASSSPMCTSSATWWHFVVFWSPSLGLLKPSTEHIKMHSQAWLLPLLLRNHSKSQGIDFLPVERALQDHTFSFHMQAFHWFLLAVIKKKSPHNQGERPRFRDEGDVS